MRSSHPPPASSVVWVVHTTVERKAETRENSFQGLSHASTPSTHPANTLLIGQVRVEHSGYSHWSQEPLWFQGALQGEEEWAVSTWNQADRVARWV